MAKTSTYLNFKSNTEAAFLFYKEVFGTEFLGPIHRMGDVPSSAGMPPLSPEEKQLVMHVALPILGGHVLMGTDTLESMGHKLNVGNNVSINLEPDTRSEADRLFKELSREGTISMPLQDMFWGAYFGAFTDSIRRKLDDQLRDEVTVDVPRCRGSVPKERASATSRLASWR
ncbi:MAG: VOC family protein [Polyangiaceae bacterium]